MKKEETKMFKKIMPAIIFGIVYAALILLGWGFKDLTGFFSHPARTIMFIVTISVTILTLLFKDKLNVELMKRGEKEDPKEKITGILLPSLISLLLMFIAPYSDSHNFLVTGGGDILRYFGLIIFLAGYVFMVWGPLHLGKQYSLLVTIQEEHELITDGPYKFMRHPRYSGIIFWVFGVALIFVSISGLVLAVLMSALMLLRIPKEERMLHQEFGKEWEDYCRRTTKKVIPFVY
ncbi:MAG: isoprenylcysteine carboxylmethyltransferase family protein [Methanophagales archaeon]|nr:isoprenylcysteine carboxylmethyltransferase family protein [Methanophagales archaeon]